MSLRVLIIEDEAPAYRRLHGLLQEHHPDLPVVEVPNIPSLLRRLGERGIWTVGLDGSAPAGLEGFDFTQLFK